MSCVEPIPEFGNPIPTWSDLKHKFLILIPFLRDIYGNRHNVITFQVGNHAYQIEMESEYMYECTIEITSNGSVVPKSLTYVQKTCQHIYDVLASATVICAVTGIPGSVATVLTMLSMDRTPTTVYMRYLAIGNLITIIINTAILHTNDSDLETFVEMVGIFPYFILAIISFERFMAVSYPFLKRRYFTSKNTNRSIFFAAVLCVIEFVVVILLQHLKVMSIDLRRLVISITMAGMPGPIIIGLSVLTLRGLKTLANQQRRRLSGSSVGWSAVDPSVIHLIIISNVVYFVLCGPHLYVHVIWFFSPPNWRCAFEFRREVFVIREVSNGMQVFHHSATFYVYVLGTKRFRRQFFSLGANSFLRPVLVRFGLVDPSDNDGDDGVADKTPDAPEQTEAPETLDVPPSTLVDPIPSTTSTLRSEISRR